MRSLLLILTLFTNIALGAASDVDKQEHFAKNLMKNGGFENGKSSWTASGGTFAIVASGSSNLLTGKGSGTWDSDSAGQTLSYAALAIPKGLYGKHGVFVCKIQVPSGTATHLIEVTDGTNTLVSNTVTSSATPIYVYANFPFPSSGSVTPRIKSVASNEPLIAIDDCHIGDASEINLTSVDQAKFIGSAYFATTANCTPIRASATLGQLVDTDCPGPTVELNPGPGTIQTTDANQLSVTVANLPPGTYRIVFTGSGGDNAGAFDTLAISDGTDTRGQSGMSSGTTCNPFSVEGVFTYSAAGDKTFSLLGASSANSIQICNSSGLNRTTFAIYRFPSTSQLALKPDASPSSWSGYHDNTCSFARTNASYGDPATDASCGLTERMNVNFGTVTGANNLPSITFTPKRVTHYFVCASVSVLGATSGADAALKLWDGTTVIAERDFDVPGTSLQSSVTLCGGYTASSVAAKTLSIQTKASTGAITIQALSGASAIEWTIFDLDQSMPAPLLANSVVSSSTGVTGIEAAKLNCDSSSAITSQHGSWVSSIGNIASGACAVTLTAGTFSATPYCTVVSAQTGGISTGLILNVDATSSTAVSVDCEDDASSACTSFDFIMHCVGAR